MILHLFPSSAAYIRKPRSGTLRQNSFFNYVVTSKLNCFSGEQKEAGFVFK